MKHTLIILILLTASIQTFAQSPRIKLNQITKDSVTGSVLISSPTDSGMVYSRDLFISYGADTVLILGGDTLAATSSIISSVLSDGVTITGDGTTGNELTADTSVLATLRALSDSLVNYVSTTELSDSTLNIRTDLNLKQDQLNGTGFVKASGTTISYDNSTYLTSEVDGSVTNEIQDISTTGAAGNISISSGSTLNLNVDDADASASNELQTLSYNSSTNEITLSDGGGTEDLSNLDLVDSTRLITDSILVYYQNGSEIGRDTISGISEGGGGGGSGTVTSVDVSGGTTGLTTSGGPITTSGTITLAGTLDVDNGGTGATSFTAGQILKGNGTSAIQSATNLRENGDTVVVEKILNVDTATLYVDATNNRVGIGTSSPSYKLEVSDTANASTIRINNDNYGGALFLTKGGTAIMFNGSADTWTGGSTTTNDAALATYQSNIKFYTNNSGAEKMRLNAAGELMIGYTTDQGPYKLQVNGKAIISDLTGTGAVDVYADAHGVLGVSSDQRLKIYDGEIENAIKIIKDLYPKYYRWKDDAVRRDAGFYAQEVLNVYPVAVVPMNNDNFYGFNSRAVLALSVKAIQEQQSIIESQATEIETLKTLITDLSNRLQILENN